MAWAALMLAGLCETAGVLIMKKMSDTGKKIYIPAIALTFALSFALLSFSMKTISIAAAYSVWTGIGAAGSVLAGAVIYKEKIGFSAVFFILLILAGAVGLKFSA